MPTPPTEKHCLRCGKVPPAEDPWHRGVGALSRTDNQTHICSYCGNVEAMEDFAGTGPMPQKYWARMR